MKLLIKEACVVKDGKIAERGDIIDTDVSDKKADRVAYELIAAGRAVKLDSRDGELLAEELAREKHSQQVEVDGPYPGGTRLANAVSEDEPERGVHAEPAVQAIRPAPAPAGKPVVKGKGK